MSSTEIYYVTQNRHVRGYVDIRNSWRGAMMVWSNLWKRYLYEDQKEKSKLTGAYVMETPFGEKDMELVCGLFKNKEISEYERAVLGSTFDRVILEKQYFQRFYDDILKYAEFYPVGSLIIQAQAILKLSKKKIIGVFWNQTSVNGDLPDSFKDTLKQKEEWYLYQEVDKLNDKQL
ncbi:MAG: hypothetical protein WC333_08355 [Dehalococcoidia bacterium]|jgi:hypothetical protein